MELNVKPGNVSCAEVRELLSDLIDVRCGELPHPDGTRLAAPGLRAAAELHLASCAECSAQLDELWEVGSAYAEFNVGELPPQHFADYGARVRERMKVSGFWFLVPGSATRNQKPATRNQRAWGLWAVTGLAAALVLAVLVREGVAPEKKPANLAVKIAAGSTPLASTALQPWHGRPPFSVVRPNGDGVQFASGELNSNLAAQQQALNQLENNESRYGYLVFGERLLPGQDPLLGVTLKTTRDVDRIKNVGPGGLMVFNVLPDSPAARMGLRKNDYIVAINDKSIDDGGSEDAVKFLLALHALGDGAPVTLHVVRPEGAEYLYMRPLQGVLGQ